MDQKDNPTPPAESASGAQRDEQGDKQADEKGGARPSVAELLAAARGDTSAPQKPTPPDAPKTVVTPPARRASTGTVAAEPPPGDSPGKSFPAATPPAARAAPTSGAAGKVVSTPTAEVSKGVAKAVAARMPAGPLTQTAPDPPVNKFRRRIVWGSIAAFTGFLGLGVLRFFLPRSIFEPSSIFRIGFPGDYALGVDTKWQQQYRVWVVRNSERLFVINAVCTHLGCTPDWKASENKFKCPCHGSGYDSEGVNFEGPAPRPMDRAEVTMDAEGQIVVNTGRLFKWEKGGTNHFDDEDSYIPI